MTSQHQEQINKIQDKLRKIHTPITIRKIIIEHIIQLYTNKTPTQIHPQHAEFIKKK